MHYKALTLAALAVTATAEVDKRAAADPAAYSAAAGALISQYIPAEVMALITPAISQAAAAASVTGDAAALLTSVLLGTTIPPWFPATQIPPAFQSQLGALTQAIAALRPVATVVVTSTDSAGSVITTTLPGTVVAPAVVVTSTDSAGSVITNTLAPSSGVVITSTNSAGSVITTTLAASGAASDGSRVVTSTNSAGSVITTTLPPTQTTEVVPLTTTNSAGSTITTSGTTTRPVSSTNAAGAMATANAAAIIGLLGVMAAL